MRGSWRPNRTAIFWPPLLWPSTLCLSRSPGLLNRRPRGSICWLSLLSLIQQLLWTPTQSGALSPFGLVWLSLPHLVDNSVRSLTGTVWLLSWLSYIIVPRPLSGLLDLWNRILDRRQAEITVMQFTGHSLPLHQSMSVPWEFFTSSHFISQFPPMRFPLITAIRMCHFLPVHHLGMPFLAGSKAKIQQHIVILNRITVYRLFVPYRNIWYLLIPLRRCPWCSRYRRRKWTRRLEFKSWTRLIAFHIALIPLGKVWIQLFSLQLWVNSRTD